MNVPDGQAKHRARAAALQMLYQCEVGRAGADESIVSYWAAENADADLGEPLREFANRLVRGTIDRRDEIDGMLANHAQNWRVERMNVIDRLVLRLAVFEMLTETDTPSKVIINEAIELARSFSGDAAVGFVNGVLDAVRKELRRA
ncbi:MAG: transcription antitermination factor NusB [Acidobacteriota bacterium]|jgi:N utilization substance protein B|nr:transcription antitermination factor NusB [Acidobacteriota bacterium]